MIDRLRALLLGTLVASCGTPRARTPEGMTPPTLENASSLDWTLGEWTGTRRARADSRDHPLRVRVTPILGGAGNLREMWVDTGGEPYHGMSIQLREAQTGQWTRYYANDVQGILVRLRANEYLADGPVRWNSGPNDKGRRSENLSQHPDADTWISTVSRTTDGGETWQVLFVDELKRTPGQ